MDVAWTEEERREFAEAIEDEARRLDRIVGNLLDLSRIEGGSLRPRKAWHDFGALVDDVVGRLRKVAPLHRIRGAVDEGLPLGEEPRWRWSKVRLYPSTGGTCGRAQDGGGG